MGRSGTCFSYPKLNEGSSLLKTGGALKKESLVPYFLVKCFLSFRPPRFTPEVNVVRIGKTRRPSSFNTGRMKGVFDRHSLCFKI